MGSTLLSGRRGTEIDGKRSLLCVLFQNRPKLLEEKYICIGHKSFIHLIILLYQQ